MRKLFACFCVSVILLWSVLFFRFGLQSIPRIPPDFLTNGDHILSDRVCAPLATILVNSAPWHAPLRQRIRETWGHPSVLRPLGLGLVFGVGMSQSLQVESAACGDLLQYPGEDEYRELPRKVSWLLGRVKTACDRPFVVKVDDDVFVNVHALQKVLLELASEPSHKRLWCLVWEGMPVIRANHSKWYVSRDTYSESLYPTYCSGAAYIMSSPALVAIIAQENASGMTTHKKSRPRGTLQDDVAFDNPPSDEDLGVVSKSNAPSQAKPNHESHSLVTSEYGDPLGIPDDYTRPQQSNDHPLVTSPKVKKRPPVTSPKTKDRLLVTSEDVYITGLLAGKAEVSQVQLGTRYAFASIEKNKIADGQTIFAHLGPDAEERLEELWDWVQKYRKIGTGYDSDKGHAQLGTRYAYDSIEQDKILDGQTIFADAEERLVGVWEWMKTYRKKATGDDTYKGL